MEKHSIGKFSLAIFAVLIFYFVIAYFAAFNFVVDVPDGIEVTPYSLGRLPEGLSYELEAETSENSAARGLLKLKFLGLIPLKTINVLLAKDKEVRIGGFPIGIDLNIDGVMVEELGSVDTAAGKSQIQGDFRNGDIILYLNDRKINSVNDLADFMNGYNGCEKLAVTLNRKGNVIKIFVSPPIDALTGKYKLGLWVKDSVTGVGTASFISSDNNFASLGHGIANDDYVIPVSGGKAYNCNIIGLNKGEKGVPGELKGMLKDLNKPIGAIYRNTPYGVYGKFNSDATIPADFYRIGSRLNVRSGKAQIYTTVNDKTDFYDIEIIRAMPQNTRCDKSMVVRVTDKRLLALSGGIVRGMSGSPIVQNGMIVGCITHVMINDPTKGYGLYMDWMY